MNYYEKYNSKVIKPVLQRIKMKSALEFWSTDELPVAKYTWVYGPKKPRDQLRAKEFSPVNVGLDSLAKSNLVDVLEPVEVNCVDDAKKLSGEADAYIIGDMEDWLVDEEILEAIAHRGRPLIAEWDSWGYSIHGRLSRFRLNRFKNIKYIIPMGHEDVYHIIDALRAIRFLRHLRVIYVGEYPPRSVTVPKGLSLDDIERKFGVKFYKTSFNEYIESIESVLVKEAKKVANEWIKKYMIDEKLRTDIIEYAKIYIGIKKLLNKYNANSLTLECPGLPDIKYVPCHAFSLLLDEGIPMGCEADLPALLTMSLLMAAARDSAFMGNLNENVTHWDIEHNIVTINHDVVPPSYGCPNCKYFVKDYHNMGRGTTSYTELPIGLKVTLAGMHWNMDKIWATSGEVVWTYDAVHCRITVGIRVEDAKRVSREAFGHHMVLVRGNHVETLRIIADLLGLEFIKL